MGYCVKELLVLAMLVPMLVGCQKRTEEPVKVSGTPITVSKVTSEDVLYVEKSLGTIDSKSAPMVNSEVNGQIVMVGCEVGDRVSIGDVLAVIDSSQYKNSNDSLQAQVRMYEAQLDNQKKTTSRYEELLKQNFVSEAKLDELKTVQKGYAEQLSSAKAALKESARNLEKSVIKSPISGVIYARQVSTGDFASVGKPMFGIVNSELLTIRAPFPEGVGGRIKKGQKVRLTTTDSNSTVIGAISDIKPFVTSSSRSFDAIIGVKNPGNWFAGGSIGVEVITDEHKNSMVVPESAVVLRPAGNVVYVVNNESVKQKKVTVGEKHNGKIEIINGIDSSEIVAVDGAGLLTDGAKVVINNKK